jgi:hypothetical protein
LKRQKEAAEQMQQGGEARKGGGTSIGDLISLAKEAGLVGGGGSNPIMEKFMNAMIEKTMSDMVRSSAFDDVYREYMVKKMAKELGEPLAMKAVEHKEG